MGLSSVSVWDPGQQQRGHFCRSSRRTSNRPTRISRPPLRGPQHNAKTGPSKNWRREQRAAWFRAGMPFPDLVFPSSAGTPLARREHAQGDPRDREEGRGPAAARHRPRDAPHVRLLLIQQGESLAYVRDQMGHASIQVTVDIYGHLVPGEPCSRGSLGQRSTATPQPRRNQRRSTDRRWRR